MSDKDVFYPFRWRCLFCSQHYGTGMLWCVDTYGHYCCGSGDHWLGSFRACKHPLKEKR